MTPNRSLAIAGSAVLLSWLALVGLVYHSAEQLRDQRASYDHLTQELLILEQMRSSLVELSAADDEFMMLGTVNRIEHAVSREQLERDHAADILAGKQHFMQAFHQLEDLMKSPRRSEALAGGEVPDFAHPFFTTIRSKYYPYITAAEKLNRLAGSHVYMSFIMKLMAEAKSLEISLKADISERIEQVKNELGTHHPLFEATITEARDRLLGLMILAMIPALLTGYLAMRGIVRMFDQISRQRQDIEKTNGNLESALAELHRVQETMVQSERLSTFGKLTATVSHELRNPMAAIRNSLFLIKESAGNREKVLANIDRAERSIARCDSIIGDLLEYTRKRDVDLQPVRLQHLVAKILDEQTLPVEIRVVTDLRGNDAKVMADPERFRRVVINLIQNAAEAIKASKGFGEVKVQTGLIGDQAFLEISDDGPGIAEDALAKIFEPLFTTKSFGAGLGLPTAKQLVEQHYGRLTVNSKPGVGASFRVTLPLAKANQEKAA
jgi:signal transduction histidine kinase